MSHSIDIDNYLHILQIQQNKLEILRSSRPKNTTVNIIQKEYDKELEENPDNLLLLKYKYYWKNELFIKIFCGQSIIEELKNLDKCYPKEKQLRPRSFEPIDFKYFIINDEFIKLYEWVQDDITYYFADLYEIFNLEIFKNVNVFSIKKYINGAADCSDSSKISFEYGIKYEWVKTDGFERTRVLISARGIYKLLNTLIEKYAFEKIFKDRYQNNFKDISRILSIASKLSYNFFI
jgi:hypothetical protein